MKHAALSAPRPLRGGAPVGRIDELAPPEVAALAYLRMWLTGEAEQVAEDFILLLGPQDGSAALDAFATLLAALASRSRPFAHHAPGCACYGGDESAFAQMLAAASEGDEEAACGFALHLFSGHPPPVILGRAARAGLALRHMASLLNRPRALH